MPRPSAVPTDDLDDPVEQSHPTLKEFGPLATLGMSELAVALGYKSAITIRRWIASGNFPKPIEMVPGGRPRWRVSTVMAWLAKRERSRKQTRPVLRGAAAAKHAAKQQKAKRASRRSRVAARQAASAAD
jgi:predicted DNA-binding transcriptional regulator AlpA